MSSNPNRPPAQRVYPSNDNANRYYDLAMDRYGMGPEEAHRWTSNQLGYSSSLQPIAQQVDTFNDNVNGRTLVKEIAYSVLESASSNAPTNNALTTAGGTGISALQATGKTIFDGYDSGVSQSRTRENYSIGRTEGQTNPNYNQPQWGHQQQNYPTYDNYFGN